MAEIASRVNNRHGMQSLKYSMMKYNVAPCKHEAGYKEVSKENDVEPVENDIVPLTNEINQPPSHDDILQHLVDNMATMEPEEFYEKLHKLKEEHRETLDKYERVYGDKILRAESEEDIENERYSDIIIPEGDKLPRDKVRDLSSKPPLDPAGRSRKEVWTRDREDIDVGHGEESAKQTGMDDSFVSSSKSIVDELWEGFSIDNYPRRRNSSLDRQLDKYYKETKTEPKKDKWTPVITVPDPFKMTIREATKPKGRSRCQEELEEDRLRKLLAEEAECSVKFKARQPPAHIYVPLYDELRRKAEQRRMENHDLRMEVLRATERPFKFHDREVEKRELRESIVADRLEGFSGGKFNRRCLKGEERDSYVKPFKARSIPMEIYGPTAADRQKEAELYRDVRVRMRAEETLRKSKLPPRLRDSKANENIRHKISDIRADIRSEENPYSDACTFHPRVNQRIPDHDEQFKQFQKESERRKERRGPTVVKPFRLRTNNIRETKDDVYKDMLRDEMQLRENRWPYQGPRAPVRSSQNFSLRKSHSMDAIPHKMTRSAELYKDVRRSKAYEEDVKRNHDQFADKQREKNERQLRRTIADKSKAYYWKRPSSDAKELRRQERLQEAEYQRKLAEIMGRVQSRPLLIERMSEENARRIAERKYERALREAGLSREFVASQATLSDGVSSYTEEDSDPRGLFAKIYVHADEEFSESTPANDTFTIDQQSGIVEEANYVDDDYQEDCWGF